MPGELQTGLLTPSRRRAGHRPEEAQRRVAGSLDRAGVGRGDRVVFCLPSSASLLLCVLGAARRGVVPVLLNATLLPAERAASDRRRRARPWLSPMRRGSRTSWPAPEVDLAPYPLVRPMHYTSGTTGRPKGVWSGVLAGGEARALFEDEADLWGFDGPTRTSCARPMYHSASIRLAAAALLRGGRVLVLRRFDAAAAVAALDDLAPTTTFMAPTALQRVVAVARDRSAAFSLAAPPRARRIAVSGAVEAGRSDRLRRGVLWEFYGSTEGQFTVCGPEEWAAASRAPWAGPGRGGASRSTTTAWCGATLPVSLVSSTGATPPPRHGRGGATPSRSETSAARRGRVPLPRRPARRPRHQWRRQRVPGRGRRGAVGGARRRRGRRLRGRGRRLGPTGVRRGGGGRR